MLCAARLLSLALLFHVICSARHGVAAADVAATTSSSAFPLGVAAGDVTQDAAVLWTRTRAPGAVRLEVSRASDFAVVEHSLTLGAAAETALVLKHDVTGLAPATSYFYRFIDSAGAVSTVGCFRTAPPLENPAPLRIIFSGDTNFAYAPFVVMGAAAAEDADLFLWDGDTIYGDVPAGSLGVAETLNDYRAKYAQVRSDPGSQTLAAAMSVWATWDDHEVVNDYAGGDARVPAARKAAGYQAFFEFMPIRAQGAGADQYRIYRSFRWGAHVEFFLLDGRQYRERDIRDSCANNVDPIGAFLGPLSADNRCARDLLAPRTMLGAAQFEWLTRSLKNSRARWKFIVNNVPFSFIGAYPYDRWDGYDYERRALLEFVDRERIEGVVILSTDIHANGYNPDVTRHFRSLRPEYRLENGIAVAELIVGPLGNETAQQTIEGAAPAGGHALEESVEAAVGQALHQVRKWNGLAFVDTDKVSYALIEVDANGAARFEYRGLSPAQIAAGEAEPETFYSGRLGVRAPALAFPCALPVFAVLAVGVAFSCRRQRGIAA